MIQEKDFLYRVPVKTAHITTPGGQIRNPEILVDVEGGEFMHGNILDANSTNKLINQSVKDAVDDKLNESGYVTKDLLEAETTRATDAESGLQAAIATKADADKYLPLTGGAMKGDILSPSYKKIGGTDEQILLADGSIATAIDADTLNSILN